MHEAMRANYLASESLTNCLVAEADTQNGRLACHVADEGDQDPCLSWGTWTGRKQYALGLEGFDFLDRNFIIPADLDFSAKFTQVLDEVVGE